MDPEVQRVVDDLLKAVTSIEDALRNHKHSGLDLTQILSDVRIDRSVLLNAMTLGDGKDHSGKITMKLAPGKGDTFIKAGTIADGDFANTGSGSGFILGIDDSDSDKVKFYFGDATSFIKWDGSTLTVKGTLVIEWPDVLDTASLKPVNNATLTIVFRQDAIPTSLAAGDLWFDSNDSDKAYRATSAGDDEITAGEWIRVDVGANPSLVDALSTTNAPAVAGATNDTAADAAQTTANSKIIVFRQAAIPTSITANDLWIDSNDSDKMYKATSIGDDEVTAGEWERIDVGANPALIDALNTTNGPAAANADVTSANTAADSALLNAIAAAQVQGRAEQFQKTGLFLGDIGDSFTEAVAGTGLITRFAINTKFRMAGGDGNALMYGGDFLDGLTWSNDYRFTARLSVTANVTANNTRMVLGLYDGAAGAIMNGTGDPALTVRHVLFYWKEDGTLVASMADGTTGEEGTITGVTQATDNDYRIDWNSGTEAKFYVNDVLKATLSTQKPSGTTTPPNIYFEFHGDNNSSLDFGGLLKNNYQIFDTIA